MSMWLLTYRPHVFKWHQSNKHLPTRWLRKPAGIDKERNYITVTLCIPWYWHTFCYFVGVFISQNGWMMCQKKRRHFLRLNASICVLISVASVIFVYWLTRSLNSADTNSDLSRNTDSDITVLLSTRWLFVCVLLLLLCSLTRPI